MKTHEEIKKGLECCSVVACGSCPYEYYCNLENGYVKISNDALAYIQQLENHIGELTEKVEQLESAQPKWISVKDDLPAHVITPCLIYANGDIETACWTHDKYGFAWWFFVDGEYETGVTHWMSLPEPPKVRA